MADDQPRVADGQSATSADPADVEALKWVRGELFSLCEATEEACAQSAADREGKPGAFARGRVHEAKGIRRAMGEVIAERLRTTRPSLPAPGREVKPLDWQETFTDRGDGSKDQTGWEADSGFGAWYAINQYFGSDSYGWEVQFDFDVIADCDDPDKAKAAAQADYEKRISAALSRPPENVDHRATEPAALRSAGDNDSARLRSAGQSDRPDDVQDTYLIGGPPDLRAMSGSVESDRIIQLHFRRRATDDDRKWLLDAINAKLLADREGPHIPVVSDKASLERVFDRLGTRLNNVLCEMKPDHDDSIVGFNEAWDVMRAIFKEELERQ